MHDRRLARLAAALAAALVVAACADDGLPGAPDGVEAALAVLPAEAVEAGVFWQRGADGFGSRVLGAGGVDALGVDADGLDWTAETGAPAATVLQGDIDRRAVAGALDERGYTEDAGRAGWRIWRRGPAADPVLAGVPAVALRRGRLVAGGDAHVDGLGQQDTVADLAWVPDLVRAAGPDADAVVVAAPPTPLLAAYAERRGETLEALLARAGGGPPLPAYAGFLVAVEAERGMVALAKPAGAGEEAARRLARRLAATEVLGAGGAAFGDRVDAQGPRWHADAGVVSQPVIWNNSRDLPRLRDEVESGALAFLAAEKG